MKNYFKRISKFSRTNRLVFYAFILIVLIPIALFLAKNPLTVRADSFLKFDEGGGTTTKDAQNNTAGTITNAIWREEQFCVSGKCLYFDGTGDYVSFGDEDDFDFIAASNFTISLWFRRAPKTSGTDVLVAKTNGSAGYKILMESDGDITFAIDDDATWSPDDAVTSTAATYDDNAWHHVAAVKTGTSKIELFIDGQLVASDNSLSATGTLINSANFYVGVDGDGSSNFFTGFIDEVNVYTTTAKDSASIKADAIKGAGESGSTAVFGQSESLSDGLVGYWKMDEIAANSCAGGSNDVCDYSGNGFDGAWNGNVATSTGIYGSGTTYDGADDYISIPHNSNLQMSTFTISGWFKANTVVEAFTSIINKDNGANNRNYAVYMNSTGVLSVGSSFSGSGVTLGSGVDVDDDAWHHFVYTVDTNGEQKVYTDGILRNSRVNSGTLDIGNTNGIRIGVNQTTTSDYSGELDEIRIYNRALTPSEANELYHYAPGPVGHWKLDENTGTTTNDSSSNNYLSKTFEGNTKWSVGKFGSSVSFDGADDNVQIAEGTNIDLGTMTDSYTLSAWVKYSSCAGTCTVVAKMINSSAAYPFHLYIDSSQMPIFSTRDSSGNVSTAFLNSAISPDTWYYLTAVRDTQSDKLFLYVNGALTLASQTATDSSVTSNTNDDDISFGASGGGDYLNNELSGNIDDVKIYNYALKPEQIIQDMNGGNPNSKSSVGSPTLHLKFDEGYGDTAYDSSSNSVDGDLAGSGGSCPGAANCPAWYNSGKLNNALDFDGTNDYVAIVDNQIFDVTDTDDITISGWFNRDTTGTEDTIIAKRNSLAAGDVGWIVSVRDTDVFDFQLSDGTDEYQMSTTQTFTTTGWNFFTVVWDQDSTNNSKIFINGNQIPITTSGTIGNVGDTSNALDLRVGTQSDGSDRFDGKIDDIKIYKSTLTDNQITILYNQGTSSSMGSSGTSSTGIADNSSARTYCVPGDNTSCTPPIGHWKFDENNGTSTTYDSSGWENNATLNEFTNGVWSQGKYGSGITFSGNDNWINFYSATLNSNFSASQGTVEFWLKPRDISIWSDGNTRMLFKLGPDTSNTVTIQKESTDALVLSYVAGGVTEQSSQTITPTDWTHLAMTWDKANEVVRYYINGILVETDTTLGVWVGALSSSRTTIGNNYNGSSAWDGSMDDVRIYNYARTPAQIAWDYNKGEPKGWWKFDENAGAIAYDASGNAYHSQTFTGDTSYTTGKSNTALTFDGNNDVVRITEGTGIDIGATTSSYAVSAWIKTNASCGGTCDIVAKSTSSVSTHPLRLQLDSNNFPMFIIRDTANSTVSINRALNDGNWHHLVAVRNVSTDLLYLYIDGKLVNSSTDSTTATCANNDDISIGNGGNSYTNNDFNGQIDDVKMYNYPLTDTQIKNIFNDGAAVRFSD